VANNSEASVEEILESIKKVIARDNRDGALEARRRRERESDQAETDATADETIVPAEEVLDLADMEIDAAADFMDRSGQDESDDEDDQEPLMGESVRGAMQENLAALAMLAEPGARPQIVRSGETSLEGLTRELLRPMLAEWLEKNLPTMVEKMVQAEIARIAGKKK
jgi:uncharacterized protein